MGLLPKKWIRWIAVGIGVAGILTLVLLEFGWIPEEQAHKAVIFLLSFMILDGAAKESSESTPAPELFTNSADLFHAMSGLLPGTKHEMLGIIRAEEGLTEQARPFVEKALQIMRSEKQLHNYLVVSARIGELTEESFQRRFEIERDPSLEGRFHYRFIESPVTFGCTVFDQKHWTIDFPSNPAEPRGGAILFRDHPEGGRLVASFIRHQWLEPPGVTMSLSEAYEKWKAIKGGTIAK